MAAKSNLFIRTWQLFKLYAKMDLLWLLKDTKMCLIIVFTDLIFNISSITNIFLLSWKFNGIGGLNRFEVLFMLGYVSIITGLFQLFFSNCNTGHISRVIGRGQFEHIFIQPVPIPIYLLTAGFIPFTGSCNFIVGNIILGIAIINLNIKLNILFIISYICCIFLSLIILLSLMYIFSSAAFYAPVQAEEISSYVSNSTGILSTYPLSGMPHTLAMPLISVFPTGLLGWFPSMLLLGKNPLDLNSSYFILITIILFIIANYLFKKGMNYYVQTGSNRYSAAGHRR